MSKATLFVACLCVLALLVGACSPKLRGNDLIECQHSGECPEGKYCVDNKCIDNVVCQSDQDCAAPTPVCDLATGRCLSCVPACQGRCCGPDGCGGTCADQCASTGQQCDQDSCQCQGSCQPNCVGRQCGPDGCSGICDPGCPSEQFCDDQGQCQSVGCQDDGDCQEPTPMCNLDSGVCLQCLQDTDCASGKICSGGVCADSPFCTSDSQCEMGQVCQDGECLAGCSSNRDCPEGQTCLPELGDYGRCVACEQPGDCQPGWTCQDYTCVPHCTSDSHCAPLFCNLGDNSCVPCLEDGHCPAEGEICEQMECLSGCRQDGDCPSGYCDVSQSRCVQCISPDDCALGSLCVEQQCVQGCLTNRDCPADLLCDTAAGEYGNCVECLLDGDCSASFVCVQGLCEFFCSSDSDCQDPKPACDSAQGLCVECVVSDDCLAGTICVAQSCLPGCQLNRDCPEPMVCDPALGQHGGCVQCLSDGDCFSGYSCDNNNCVIEGSDMIRLPGGSFVRGSDSGEGEADEYPESGISLPTFYLDRTEVTNNQFRACVQAGACSLPADVVAYNDQALGNNPVVYVTWDQARDFCVWMGKGLPTEARWERAARGPQPSERTYPWGDGSPNCSLANYSGCQNGPSPVGSTPAGATPDGLLDMAGNVYEWVYDWYGETYYADSSSADDPFGPLDGSYRVARGGAFDSPATNIRTANRAGFAPDSAMPNVGFRCAMRGSPVAGFLVEPEVGPYASTNFAVDAGLTTDANHPADALEVHWDWEDDGSWDTVWTTAKTASHRYAFNGIFRIRLEVRDPDGNLSTMSREVVAQGQGGWDGDVCASDQECAHGFVCVMTLTSLSYQCREECMWLIDADCHLPGQTCGFTLDPMGSACLPE